MRRAFPTLLLIALAAAGLSSRVASQEPAPVSSEERARRDAELRQIEAQVRESEAARQRLAAEIAELKTDGARLARALVETTGRAQAAEQRIGEVTARLETLTDSESALRASLEARRGTIADVLATLQRMGRRLPPAVLVRPEDVLAAIRSSMLLGSVVPGLRAEAESLATDLAELVRLRTSITAERDNLQRDSATLASEQERLSGLVRARQERLAAAEAESGAEKARAAALALQAKSLKELLEGMEGGATVPDTSSEAGRVAEAQARANRQRFAAAAFRDPAQLAPKIPFANAKGTLPRPVVGVALRDFGEADGLGGTMHGLQIRTRPKALVGSPADGWVVFAGPFRSFGRVLIINAGGGYYILIAGMEQISVDVGQFVLGGEAVGQMGEVASPSAALGTVEGNAPVLYVEFRKDGVPVDPGPWWAKSQGEKVRG